MRKAFAPAVVMAAFLCACTSAPEPSASPEAKSLISIGETELTSGELRYLITTSASMGEIDWNGMVDGISARRYVLQEALSMAVSSHVTKSKAGELGFILTDEEEGEIDWDITLEAEYRGGREAFTAWLAESEMTEELYRFYSYEVPFLQQKMIDGLFGPGHLHEPGEEKERAFFSENYLTVSYIFISATDDHGEPLTGDRFLTQKSVADALRRQAVAGEDFAGLVETHGHDYMMSLSPEGRTVPPGELNIAAETALVALPEGGISEVIEADGGFYILKRLPDDWEWFDLNREDVRYLCAEDSFYKMLAEWSAAADIHVSDAYYELDPLEWIAVG